MMTAQILGRKGRDDARRLSRDEGPSNDSELEILRRRRLMHSFFLLGVLPVLRRESEPGYIMSPTLLEGCAMICRVMDT